MDVDHEGVTLPRRRMRRPVAAGIGRDPLERWLEDEPAVEVPAYVWGLVGFVAGGLAVVAVGSALLAWLLSRWRLSTGLA